MKKTELSHDDRQRLHEELNKLPIWQDGGAMGEKSVLRAAGFPDNLVGQIMLTGTSAIDTPNLFSHLQGFGHLTTKPTHTALGALVEYLVHNTSDLDSQRFLGGLIKKYHLIDEKETSNQTEVSEIFLSYSDQDKGQEVAEAVNAFFRDKGITVLDNSREIVYKGLISEFISRLGCGKYVIVVLSDAYLKSKDCMKQLMLLAEQQDFYDRIFPVTVKQLNIQESENLLTYIAYWDEKIDTLQEKIRQSRDLSHLEGIHDDLNLYKDIRSMFARLLTLLRDMNTRPLQGGKFDVLFQAIQTKIADDAHPVF